MNIYDFKAIENAGISEQAKEIITLGEEANRVPNFDYNKLATSIVSFEFIVPIIEKDDYVDFPTMVLNKEDTKDLFVPVFTCYGEMYKALYKLGVVNNYDKLMTVKIKDFAFMIENLDYQGFIIDPYGIALLTDK